MQALIDEGKQQQHCVVVYDRDIIAGRYYVYQILQPERATLGIKIKPDKIDPSLRTLVIDQIQGSNNQTVTNQTRTAILTWFNSTRQAESNKLEG